MRTHLLSAISAAAFCSALCLPTQAQPTSGSAAQARYDSGANASRFGVAVVDVSFLFKEYPKFTAAMEGLKAEMKQADAALTTKRDEIVQLEKQRDEQYTPGSPNFKQLDEQIARMKADFQIQTGTLRRDIAEKESKIYYSTYTDVSNAITNFARRNNIGLVLRFVGDDIDPSQQKDIMRAVTQPIVFQNNIDITPFVRDILNSQAPQGRAAQQAVRPAANRTR